MAKPILYNINAFDKSNSQEFQFEYQGNQAFKNKLTIYNSTTNAIVYSQEQITMQLKHVLPPDSLQNGICYTADVIVYDKDGNASSASDKIVFYCFTTPIFGFVNITTNQVIGNSAYDVQIQYAQQEDEPITCYQVSMYDYAKTLMYDSGMKYDTENMHYLLSNLEDNSSYFIRMTGITLNGINMDTGFIPFFVEYIRPAVWSRIIAENLDTQGIIKLSSNIVSVIGTSNPDPPKYIDNEMVDLTEDGSWVKWEEGYQITGDFTLMIHAKGLIYGKEIILPKSDSGEIKIRYCIDQFNGQESPQVFLELSAYNELTRYYLISNFIDEPADTSMVSIWVRRVGGLFDLKLANMEAEVSE